MLLFLFRKYESQLLAATVVLMAIGLLFTGATQAQDNQETHWNSVGGVQPRAASDITASNRSVGANSDDAELILVDRENLGDGIHARGPTWHNGTLHVGILSDAVHGHGQGEDFTYWKRAAGSAEWIKRRINPDHNPGMVSIVPLTHEDALILYVDRRDREAYRVHLIRTKGKEYETVFSFSDTTGQVLNPVIDPLPDGRFYVMIPDRNGYTVRRFIVDLGTGKVDRLTDIKVAQRGARIYDRLIHNGELIVPLALVNELRLLVIDLDDQSHEMYVVDEFASASNEPPRAMNIFSVDDEQQFLMTYLRPASFSDRHGKEGPATGLLGEIVVSRVSQDNYKVLVKRVVAGFSAEEAATHNYASAMAGPRELVIAHTEVDRIHQRHLTGEYENYNGGYVTLWRLEEGVRLKMNSRKKVKPFWYTGGGRNMIRAEDNHVYFFYNRAQPDDPLVLDRWKVSHRSQ